MKNKLKIGDKVRIRNDLKGDNMYGGLYFDPSMEQYNGETHVITSMSICDNYHLDIDSRLDWAWNDAMVELVVEFTKADLKPGMVVEYMDGQRRIVLNDCFMNPNKKGYLDFSDFSDDLISRMADYTTIKKVYLSRSKNLSTYCDIKYLTLIWEREEVKEMTVAEIEKQLGYKVKIVDGE